jgi:outer membrane protein assembly factor BamB
VTALDRSTGKARWVYDTRPDGGPLEFHGDPLVTEDLLILGSDWRREGRSARVYAFEKGTGSVRWKYEAGAGVTTDLPRRGDMLFGVTLADELVALDVPSGLKIWSVATGEPNPEHRLTSSPAVLAGQVFFGGIDGSLQALDAETGAPLWKRSLGSGVSTSILVAYGSLYAGTEDGRLLSFDPATGESRASIATVELPHGRLAAADGCVLAHLGERRIACAESALSGFRWTREAQKDWSSSRPYVWRNYVLAADSHTLVALRLADGATAWSRTFPGVVRGIGIGEDAMYVGTLSGAVHAVPLPPIP